MPRGGLLFTSSQCSQSLLLPTLERNRGLLLAALGLGRAGSDLIGRADHDQRTGEAWNTAANEEQVVLRVDLHHREGPDGDALVAIPARSLEALLRPTATAVAGQRRGRAGLAVNLLGAVGGG